MKPHIHILASLPIAIILYFFFKEYALIFFFASFLFDVDHYIDYALTKKDFSLINAYKYCVYITKNAIKNNKINFKQRLHFFHTIEFYLIMFIIAFYSKTFLFVFLGIMYHQLIDYMHMLKYPILKKSRAFSLIMWLKKNYSPSKSTKLKTL